MFEIGEIAEIKEESGRLVVRLYRPGQVTSDGMYSLGRTLLQTIDITAHIERAVENVLWRERSTSGRVEPFTQESTDSWIL
jgi:hypothetical protein